MKKFKNVFLLAAMAVSAVCVTSCGEDDDKDNGAAAALEIKAVVEDGDYYDFDEVKVTYADEVLTTGTYANGGFTLTLPAAVPDKYLAPMSILFAFSGAEVSDVNAKYFGIDASNFRPYESGEAVVGYSFNYEPEFLYVDRNVTITPRKLDAYQLKKGWNITYESDRDDEGFSYQIPTPPSGVTYKWTIN